MSQLAPKLISDGLALFAKALRFPKAVDGELVAAWVLALQSAGVTEEEWQEVRSRVLVTMSDFPTPFEVLKMIRQDRARLDAERWNAAQLHGTKLVLPGDPGYVEPKALPARGRPELAADVERRMGQLVRRIS